MLKKVHKKIHLVGIGGIGMSALAAILLKRNYIVTGSDIEESDIVKGLAKKGARINIGHAASNIGGADLVVFSSCIKQDNPEMTEARKRHVPVVERGILLKSIVDASPTSIVVAGTHGKTTTTALISFILQKCGLSPLSLIGGIAASFRDNVTYGESGILVTESDESDGSFLYLKADYGVITNIEDDHLDYYGDMRSLAKAFRHFAANAKKAFYYNIEDAKKFSALKNFRKKGFGFGLKENPHIYARKIEFNRMKSRFECVYNKRSLGRVVLSMPGTYNILNALPGIAIGIEMGAATSRIKGALENFAGVKRRFQVIGSARGIRIIEDYAHHPTAITRVLEAARIFKPGSRVIAVFQPHRFTRTRLLAKEFAKSLEAADISILTDIYAASEAPIRGVTTGLIYERMRKTDPARKVRYIPRTKITSAVANIAKRGDTVLVLGAGDIGKVSREILTEIIKKDVR